MLSRFYHFQIDCWAGQDKNKTIYHTGLSTVYFQTIMIRSLMNKLYHEWIIDEPLMVSLGMVFFNQSFALFVGKISEACD